MSNFSQFQELTVHLSKLRKMSAKSQSELLKPYDISNRHATYIIALSEDNGMTMKELSDALCVDPANTTRVIATLTEKGYVVNDCKKSGCRKFKVFLTEKGNELASQIKEGIKNNNQKIFSVLTDEEREMFWQLLLKVVKANNE